MSDEIKVSELPVASQINNADLLMIIQGGANKKAAAQLLLDIAHPVGSIYWSTDNTNPSSLFGGTWEQIKDKFILAAGTTYTAGATGGEATHTLTVNEIPSHRHEGLYWQGDSGRSISLNTGSSANGYQLNWTATADNNKISTAYTGGGQAHNNMPPYLVAYCWKRTA